MSKENPQNSSIKFGTGPVFFTTISTILGAILFLRFGYAVNNVGFMGVLLIIFLGHIVTIPTALAVSELATNKRVEGGGVYYIISRSFGMNIGAAVGLVLYLSQAISIAFYVIAFTEAFSFFFDYLKDTWGIILPRQAVSVPVMLILSALIIKKGADVGMKALYAVVIILAISLFLFFIGSPTTEASSLISKGASLGNMGFKDFDNFFLVFAIVFPAFTGMTAGVGLSGDLKNPGKSIPIGTIAATLAGMLIYIFAAYKLAVSATHAELGDQMIMTKIAIWGFVAIPVGLAAASISSALGSAMVAPRTLQALANDESFPSSKLNNWLGKGRDKDNEPVNASVLSSAIALVFVALGDVDAVAQIISMFYMLTYSSVCLISFLHHFGSSPSYRPTFKSYWLFSLIGFVASIWIMFQISSLYSILALIFLTGIYIYIETVHKDRRGFEAIFANSIFQLNRRLQVFVQQKRIIHSEKEWRPSVICISKNTFEYKDALKLLNWLSYKFGFGTYLHFIKDFYSDETNKQAKKELNKILNVIDGANNLYVNTIISPSDTSAIVQSIQLPGIAGMENNMLLFDYDKSKPEDLKVILDNYQIVKAGNFDICVLAVSRKPTFYKNGIHVWIKTFDELNTNLMILMSFIILGHSDWKNSNIKIHYLCEEHEVDAVQAWLDELIKSGRLPIFKQNIEIVFKDVNLPFKQRINEYSDDAGLTIIGFNAQEIEDQGEELFTGYDNLGNILFVNASSAKVID